MSCTLAGGQIWQRARRREGTGQLGSGWTEPRPAVAAARREESGEPGRPVAARRGGSEQWCSVALRHSHGRTVMTAPQQAARVRSNQLKNGQLLR